MDVSSDLCDSGLPATVLEAFTDVFERWDGHGPPNERPGEAVHPIARIVGTQVAAEIRLVADLPNGAESTRS